MKPYNEEGLREAKLRAKRSKAQNEMEGWRPMGMDRAEFDHLLQHAALDVARRRFEVYSLVDDLAFCFHGIGHMGSAEILMRIGHVLKVLNIS